MVSILDSGGSREFRAPGAAVVGPVGGLVAAAIDLLAPLWPPSGNCFMLSLDGVALVGAFTRIEGLSMELDVETITEGGENQHQIHLPRGLKWGPITFSRGLTVSSDLFRWMKENSGYGLATQGNVIKGRNLSITCFTMHSPVGIGLLKVKTPVRTWNVENAFPTRWSGPNFAATSNETVGESLTVVHDGFVEGGAGGSLLG